MSNIHQIHQDVNYFGKLYMFLSYMYKSFVCSVMGNYWMFMDRLKNLVRASKNILNYTRGNKIDKKNTLMY